MSLDPQIAGIIEQLDSGFPDVHTMTGAQVRAVIKSRFVAPAAPEPVADVRDDTVDGVPVRIYRPSGDDLPVLVYAHGGGFVFCDLDSHDGLSRAFANLIPAVVISVAYRLAPENQWPAAAEDVYTVARWASALGDRVLVGGDSAGGNLAAMVCLRARDALEPPIQGQLLFYPVTAHYDPPTPSYGEFAEGHFLTRDTMRWFIDRYSRVDVAPMTVLRSLDGKRVLPLERADVSRLLGIIEPYLPEQPWFYEEDALTDRSERFMAGEMIRQLMVDLDEALDRSMRENLGIFLKPPG